VAELYRRTEGWPTGLYLAALYFKEGGSLPRAPRAAASFGGDDRLVSEYLESEFLARVPPEQRTFLTRTAVLRRMCGPLCDAVLQQSGSAAVLADLERSNLLLVPLDRRGEWYRYHHLFRDMLLAELHRTEPDLMTVLRRRAAEWCLSNELAEEALEYTIAAGDTDAAAGLMEQLAVLAWRQGRVATVQRWFQWLEDRGGMDGHPMAAVLAALLFALIARPAEAERWANVVDHWQYGDPARPDDPSTEAWAALVRAIICRHGLKQMRDDADEAVARFATESFVTSAPALMQGTARVLSGDLDGGDAALEDAASVAEKIGSYEDLVLALCERALVALERSEWDRAEVLAGEADAALRQARRQESYAAPLVYAVQARAALHRGDLAAVRRHLVNAQRLRPLLTYALPHFALQARLELTRVYIALADVPGARTLMREIDALLRRRPDMGNLPGQAETLRAQLSRGSGTSGPAASALTVAELRLLPLLCTHLSIPEIAGEVFLSRNTVKTQVNSIYRKLGVASRNEAVTRSRDLGLLAE
jgi:LuxR family maltose regulon positive regulatory protein